MTPSLAHRLPFHYAWLVAVVSLIAVFASLGLGRFALGMLLPAMGQSLDLDYQEMGFISTANFVGYFFAVAVTAALVKRLGKRNLIAAGLVIGGLSMAVVSRADSVVAVLFAYAATGLASGFANVTVMTLAVQWFHGNVRGRAQGIVVTGSGVGIMFTALLVPSVNAELGPEGWRFSWSVMAALLIAVAALCFVVMRDTPDAFGLKPAGKKTGADHAATFDAPDPKHRARVIMCLGAVFMMFGGSYPIFVTFIVTDLVTERGMAESDAGTFWLLFGALSLLSGPVFGTLSDFIGRKLSMAIVYAMHLSAYLLAASSFGPWALYVAIVLFGSSAWAIPSLMGAAVGDYLVPAQAVSAFAAITLAFSVGQIAGPFLGGILAERSGDFALSYLLAASMAGVAIVLTTFLPHPPGHGN